MALFGFFSGKNKTPHQLLADGNLKGALKGFLELHEAKPGEPIFMVQIAEIYKKLGKPESALPFYIKVGNHFINRGFVNKAVASFKKALDISPENKDVLEKLGELNPEASRFMLNDSYFERTPEEPSNPFEEDFDITQEEISLAEESLRLELEQASSEIDNFSIKTLPDFGFEGLQEKLTKAAENKTAENSVPNEILEKTPDIVPETPPSPSEHMKSVFKNRTSESTEKKDPPRLESDFNSLDDALDAAFNMFASDSKKDTEPTLLRDPESWTLFKGMDKETFMDIVKALKSNTFEPGEYIITQGTEGSEMFLIVEGQVEVKIQTNEFEKKVAVLKSGEFFGEGAILTKSKRNASIKAIERTEVLTLSKKEFVTLVKKHPQILSNMKLPVISRKKLNRSLLGSDE